jgi:hypothetical protein
MTISSAAIALSTLINGGEYDLLKSSGVQARLTSPERAQDILELTKASLAEEATDELMAKSILSKSVTVATGLTAYQLRAPSLLFYPVITPVRNSLRRNALTNPGDAAHWKAINALSNTPNNMGWVPEGRRAASISYSAANKSATYASQGTEDSLTDEAKFAAAGFEDEEALIQLRSLYKLMTIEESALLFGNNSLSLATPGTPTLSASGVGTLPNATYSVIVVALTAEGLANASLATGVLTPQSITSNDGQGAYTLNGGSSAKSAAGSQATTGTQNLNASVTAVAGAAGYAWFVGTAGSEKLEAITTLNSVVFNAPLAGTHQAATAITANWSNNSIAYDGLVTQTWNNSGSGAYIQTFATGTPGVGTQLTATGSGEITEIRNMLKSMWDNSRVSVSRLYVSSQELVSITKLVLAGGSAPLVRLNSAATAGGPGEVRYTAGAIVGWYFNGFTADGGRFIPIILHPSVPAGTIFGYAEVLPPSYMSNETPTVAELLVRQDYYVEKWARTSRTQFYGTYCQSVPAIYAPFCFGIINNIAPTV